MPAHPLNPHTAWFAVWFYFFSSKHHANPFLGTTDRRSRLNKGQRKPGHAHTFQISPPICQCIAHRSAHVCPLIYHHSLGRSGSFKHLTLFSSLGRGGTTKQEGFPTTWLKNRKRGLGVKHSTNNCPGGHGFQHAQASPWVCLETPTHTHQLRIVSICPRPLMLKLIGFSKGGEPLSTF